MKNFQTILTISLLCLGLSSGGKLKDPSKFRADKISMRNGKLIFTKISITIHAIN